MSMKQDLNIVEQVRKVRVAPLSRKAAECIEAAKAEGIARTNPMWPDASLKGARFKRVCIEKNTRA